MTDACEADDAVQSKPVAVDELITAVPGDWRFDDQVAEHFDSHVRKSVPLYDHFQGMVVEVSEWFVRDNMAIYDLGCATGQTIALLRDKHRAKRALRFVGIDNSYAMTQKAREKCPEDHVNFLCQNLSEVPGYAGAGLVVAVYTLQFLSLDERRRVLSRIQRDLAEGGALIVVEKVHGETALFEDIWVELHWDMKLRAGFTCDQVIAKARSLRGVMVPLTLSENMRLLREVGFGHVDVFAKMYNFAGFVAVKLGVPAENGRPGEDDRITPARPVSRP
jgi:tRNA (cmo5U34)-methyltransferase